MSNDTVVGTSSDDTQFGDATAEKLLTNGDFSNGTTAWTVNNPTGGNAPRELGASD